MARREGKKQQILNRLADSLCETILGMEIGSKTSIGRLVNQHYESLAMKPGTWGSTSAGAGQRTAGKPMWLPVMICSPYWIR